MEERSFPIDVAKVYSQDVPIYLKGVGTLQPYESVELRPQISGLITDILYDEGTFVKKGQLLVTIDSRLYEADLEIAKASLGAEEASYRLNYDITKRMANLVGENYVSEVEYEKSLTKLESAHSSIEKTHAQIKKAAVTLGFTQIYAPIEGYTGQQFYDIGNYVTPNDKNSLVVINRINPLTVQFSLPSYYVEKIRQKQEVSPLYLYVERPSKEKHMEGSLEFINNQVNQKTGMILLNGVIPNDDESGWPGEFVRVYLLIDTLKDATVIPTEAIVVGQDDDFVFVVNEETMRVEIRKITTIHQFGTYSVIEHGLYPGETIVLDGQINLREGVKVHLPKGKVDS